jgi:hemin uptake protein HemP
MNASFSGVRAVGVRHATDAPARVASAELLAGQGVIVIEHAGQEYYLRHTKTGKLILTK